MHFSLDQYTYQTRILSPARKRKLPFNTSFYTSFQTINNFSFTVCTGNSFFMLKKTDFHFSAAEFKYDLESDD